MNEQPRAGYDPLENLRQLRPSFASSRTQLLAALAMFPAAYVYILAMFEGRHAFVWAVAALLIAATEALHWQVKRSWESWVWLGCFVAVTCSAALGIERVWYLRQTILFVHIFAVWWVLSRSGKLLEGKSGHLLPLDAVNGFVLLPFGGFFLRLRTLLWGLRQPAGRVRDKGTALRAGWLALAVVACALLFTAATALLMRADAGFSALLEGLEPLFRLRLDAEFQLRLLLSLPVGAWLFGLVDGALRQPVERLEQRRAGTERLLTKIQKVPAGFWMGVVGAFSALYLAFFILQGSYLFGAFTRTLPEGFIVSEYARQGFFELCKVMGVNFALLWLVTRMVSPETRSKPGFLAVCLTLLAESLVFAVIALSKLGLYISCFGFTPLRLQSSWLAGLLLAGCLLWAWSLLTGRPAFRKWMVFGAVTLSLLTLV